MKLNTSTKACQALFLALLAAGPLPLGAAPQEEPSAAVRVLSLDEAVHLALTGNPGLQASDARVDAAGGRADQSRKWSNPELELSAEDWPLHNGRGYSDAKRTIGIAQTLPYPGKKSLDRQIGQAGVKLSEAELALRRIELVRDVKAGFFRVLAAGRLVEVSTQLVAVAESSAVTAQKRVDAGAAAFQEQLRAEVQLEQARSELGGFQRELATARQVLATLLGEPGLREAKLSGALAERVEPGLIERTPAAGWEGYPSVRAAQAALEQARLAYRRARLEPYPDVKVGVSGGYVGDSDQSIVQLGFSVPLPLIDRAKGRQQETRATVRVAEAELHAVRQQLEREWANAQKRYRTAVEQVSAYRERMLPKAADALRLVQTGFEEGKFSFIDLLDTQRTTAEARLVYQQKLFEMNIAQAELEALLQPHTNQPLPHP